MTLMANTGYSQLGGSSIFELQAGNLPYSDPPFLFSDYGQLNLRYRFKGFKSSIRTEYFINQFEERRYLDLSQFQFQYSKNRFKVTAGHYYDMLGNGLLVRAFEVPANVYEDRGYRVRHGFYRDLTGLSAGYSGDLFRLKALYGKPLVNVLPPTVDRKERRIDALYAVNPGITLAGQNIDVTYMMNAVPGEKQHFGSL